MTVQSQLTKMNNGSSDNAHDADLENAMRIMLKHVNELIGAIKTMLRAKEVMKGRIGKAVEWIVVR